MKINCEREKYDTMMYKIHPADQISYSFGLLDMKYDVDKRKHIVLDDLKTYYS